MGEKLKKFRPNENPLSIGFTQKLNALIDATEKANNISVTAKGIRGYVKKGPKGNQIILSSSKTKVVGGVTAIRKAICKEDASSDNLIEVNLFDSAGSEITTGTTGIDFNIDTTCFISNGTALNAAVPRLETGDIIFVMTDPTDTWVSVNIFMTSEDCLCL